MRILSHNEFEKLITENPKKRYAFFEKYIQASGTLCTQELHVTNAFESNPKFGATYLNSPDVLRNEILINYDWDFDADCRNTFEFWVLEKNDIDEILDLFKSVSGIEEEE